MLVHMSTREILSRLYIGLNVDIQNCFITCKLEVAPKHLKFSEKEVDRTTLLPFKLSIQALKSLELAITRWSK